MGILFRICAILIVFEKYTESRYTSSLEESLCRPLISDAVLKNKSMTLNGGNERENSVRFKCDDGLMSNVPNLKDIWFKCKYESQHGVADWKGQGVGVVTKEKRTSLFLKNITCLPGCSRYDYSKFPDNMGVQSTSIKTLNVLNRDGEPFDRNTYFLSGDTITLECKDGYSQKSVAEQRPENYQTDYYYETLEVLTTSLRCGEDGKWNNGIEANFGICKEITCDATPYREIKNGVITNSKDVYTYSEMLTLQCDRGFRPFNNRHYIQCLTDDSFEDNDFKCEAITCSTPPEPLHGRLETTSYYYFPNETVEFSCDYGYTMIGSPVWECQPDGEWDESCIQCIREDDFCKPPCVPFGARVVDVPKRIDIGTLLEFGCNGKVYGGSTNRTCLFNTQWSDDPIDCTGRSLFTHNTGINLKEALNNVIINANKSQNPEVIDANTAQSRSIQKGYEHGVDAYILIDVSKSIEHQELELMKKFLIALVKNLGVTEDQDGTRVAVYLFATAMKPLCQQYPEPITENGLIAIINNINDETIKEFQKEKGVGTAISSVLDDVRIDILSKEKMGRARAAQQVAILISDGKYTQRGSPIPIATELKDKLGVELFTIFVGNGEDTTAYHVMKDMASIKEGEQHFFAIDITKTTSDMMNIIDNMIKKVPDVFCGETQPVLTKTKTKTDNQSSSDADAEKDAWPWMAQFRNQHEVLCGGSLINNRWILTAAHCFFPKNCEERINKVVLKKWSTNKEKEHEKTITRAVNYACPYSKETNKGMVFVHEKYKHSEPESVTKNFTYDIALFRLPTNESFDSKLNAVCLWDNTTEDMKTISYDSLFANQKYGVVTGWGWIATNTTRRDLMKQMQFPIQNFTTCINKWPVLAAKLHLDEDFMFCAGSSEQPKVIDACPGDSGGPFVVEHPRIDNKYVQIGIVSFGLGGKKNECREHPYKGFYTKLNKELLDWVNSTISKNSKDN